MRVLRKGYKKKLLVLLSISVVSLPLTWLVGHSPQDGATETAQDERWFHPSLYGGDVAQQGKLLDSWRYNDLTNALDHAYRSQWVGFTNLSRVNCSQAFSPECRNKAFP
ncbi:uncharacterized protein LOC106011713, partial [Aplysia californica]|uniref:Uncharacterized protein LOC106011713 n=1 Tax=Aplysia californica TaxID=6500 RepID=A0ABM0ZZH0_APLCA